MVFRVLTAFAVLAILSFGLTAVISTAAAQTPVTVNLGPQNNSGISGTATLTAMGNQTQVVIRVTGSPAGASHPAHIHDGTCANLNPAPKYPLSNVDNGTSTTMVNATLAQIQAAPMAINLHQSAAQVSTYVACGNISTVAAAAAPAAPAPTTALPRTGERPLSVLLGLGGLGTLLLGAGWLVRRRLTPR